MIHFGTETKKQWFLILESTNCSLYDRQVVKHSTSCFIKVTLSSSCTVSICHFKNKKIFATLEFVVLLQLNHIMVLIILLDHKVCICSSFLEDWWFIAGLLLVDVWESFFLVTSKISSFSFFTYILWLPVYETWQSQTSIFWNLWKWKPCYWCTDIVVYKISSNLLT